MCLWEILIFPRSFCLFCCRKYVDRSWEYINRSQTHECGNWDWGRAIPIRKEFITGIFVAVHAVFKEGAVLPVLQGIRAHFPHACAQSLCSTASFPCVPISVLWTAFEVMSLQSISIKSSLLLFLLLQWVRRSVCSDSVKGGTGFYL